MVTGRLTSHWLSKHQAQADPGRGSRGLAGPSCGGREDEEDQEDEPHQPQPEPAQHCTGPTGPLVWRFVPPRGTQASPEPTLRSLTNTCNTVGLRTGDKYAANVFS